MTYFIAMMVVLAVLPGGQDDWREMAYLAFWIASAVRSPGLLDRVAGSVPLQR
jgi:hypothetical protein